MKRENRKRLLYIVESMGGGVFTYIVYMANELVHKYDVYVAYGLRPQTPGDYRTYFDPRVHLIQVENFTRSIDPVRDVKAFREIRGIANRLHPDLIHLHSSKAGALGRIAFSGKKIPLFYTPHGYSFLMNDCSRTKRMLYYLIEWTLAKRKCVTLSCSEGEHRETRKLTGRAEQVDSGINTEELDAIVSSAGEMKEHPFTVFTLGRITYPKNPELFNEIAKKLPEVSFLWIGDGELRGQLTAENITITGWMDRKQAIRESIKTDVFILPSRWEGLPMSLLEAMYMKKLCVVSRCMGNRDVIHDGENGFICDTADAYAEVIKAAQTGKGQEQIQRAYSEIKNHYNVKEMAREYAKLYEKYGLKA